MQHLESGRVRMIKKKSLDIVDIKKVGGEGLVVELMRRKKNSL